MKTPVLGFAMCGSFCTFAPVLEALEELHTVFPDIIPIMSDVSYETDSRFGEAASFRKRLESICGREILHTIPAVEPIGPKALLDALVIAPCTGNHCQACKRHRRHAGDPGGQSAPAKRSAHHPRRLHERRARRKRREHRKASGPQALLLRPLPAGFPAEKAPLDGRGFHQAHRHRLPCPAIGANSAHPSLEAQSPPQGLPCGG